ncbi:MAG: Trk family potassium uptake protein [Clostridiales bacterium]|nr:Trk family potassium uptake protein [Clostridiales bacterium]
MHRRNKPFPKHPPMSAQGVIALGFAAIIALVTLLLMLPASSRAGTWTDPLTALFTATSAVCVTGLVVVDTATHWSVFGRCVLLAGIQIGGLGVMTVIALAAMMMNRRIGLRQRTLLVESVATLHIGGIVRLVRRALYGTLLLELAGALLLALRFVPLLGPGRGVFYAVFHAVSAFCNAGFDLMGTVTGPFSSLESFVSDPLVNLVAVSLILLGGLGFFVWDDLIENKFRFRRLQLHTRVVLVITPVIVLVPACLFYVFEAGASMGGMSTGTRMLASLFSAVTPRTAGFDTVPTAELSSAGSLLTVLLMLTGGNPGSTAGGAKTTTMLVLLLLAVSILRREEDIRLFGRRLPEDLMRRACSIVIIYVSLAMLSTLAICAAQPELALQDVIIEVFSAINTVGMSTGLTRELGTFARLIIILLMYAGRLGSLTFALLIARHPSPSPLRCPQERILIG